MKSTRLHFSAVTHSEVSDIARNNDTPSLQKVPYQLSDDLVGGSGSVF
ncbi:hypothetical protein LINPERPRIM_LOCUS25150, partial [Linum perenne]